MAWIRSGLWLVLGLVLNAGAWGAEPAKPNILFILADDLGWGDLACYGNTFVRTPNLDRLASEGTLFTNFYVCGSVCSPSRCAFFTGTYPARQKIHGHFATPELNGNRGMPQWLDPSVLNMARLTKSAGYATAHVGKWHLTTETEGAPQITDYGFDHFGSGERGAEVNRKDPYYRANSTKLFVDETLKFISDQKGKPFFVQLWTLIPHATLNPTDEQIAVYDNLSNANIPHKSARTLYYATLGNLDFQIGRLMKGLEDLGVADDTLVLFSSDNGPEEIFIRNAGHTGVGSPGPFRGRKRSLYEGGVRVPFLVRWPGHVPAGRIDDDSIVAGCDLLPTVAKLTGGQVPEGTPLDGEDVSDILIGTSRSRARPLMWEWRFNIAGHPANVSPGLAIRDGAWKLLVNRDGSRTELYDIAKDRMQVDNVAAQHPETVERLSKQVIAWSETLPEGPRDRGNGKNSYPWPGHME
ncbi:Arylsulfatase [Caulifigura coniformis]|uniref:Arylsulfatase n=1 Tax=Caulifigura coniformis TaxID=2527983 RepID=A0A517SMM4_9PLAN|nr:sulfatase-like hydrolase/transferase [Caulifigura coniformis]QDT57368.1 Arylsulfatase [Caulifigura coniformis]